MSKTQYTCVICLGIYVSPHITNCKHVFCKWCIHESLQGNLNCPFCRSKLSEVNFCCKTNDQIVGYVNNLSPGKVSKYKTLVEEREKLEPDEITIPISDDDSGYDDEEEDIFGIINDLEIYHPIVFSE